MKTFDEVFVDKTKYGVKVQTSEYGKSGTHIIVDQGQSQIAGYTDREDGLFKEVPAIVFGDHTRVIKYVNESFFLGADGLKVLRSKDENANYKYLYYALKNAKIPDTGYNRHFKWLKKIQIEYPDSNEQAKIVKILDEASYIISKKKAEIQALDNLIRARFVEMFGDPVSVTNEEKVELSELCEKITDGEHGSVQRISQGHPFLNAKHIQKSGNIDWSTITFIGDADHQRIYKRCNPEKGDILLTTTGTIGNVAIMPEYEEVSIDRGITLLKINHKKVTSEFIAEMLKQESIQMQMGANVHASAIGHLFMNKVKKLSAILPAMEKQMEFTRFVRQVNKSKIVAETEHHTAL